MNLKVLIPVFVILLIGLIMFLMKNCAAGTTYEYEMTTEELYQLEDASGVGVEGTVIDEEGEVQE